MNELGFAVCVAGLPLLWMIIAMRQRQIVLRTAIFVILVFCCVHFPGCGGGTDPITNDGEVAKPTFDPADQTTFTPSLEVQISCATSDASIYFTTDGTEPDELSNLYTTPIYIAETTTINAIACKDGMIDSQVASQTFTRLTPDQVAKPTFDPDGGEFTDSVDVAISCGTQEATIYYTTDGTTPTSLHGTVFDGPIHLTATTTVNAIACKDGMIDSQLACETFTRWIPNQVAMPTFDPNGGEFTDSVDVAISCGTQEATICYTTDDSEPDQSTSAVYSDPLHITETTTLKAKAFKPGMTPSETAQAQFSITHSEGERVICPDKMTVSWTRTDLGNDNTRFTVSLVALNGYFPTAWDGSFTGTLSQHWPMETFATVDLTYLDFLSPADQSDDSHYLVDQNMVLRFGLDEDSTDGGPYGTHLTGGISLLGSYRGTNPWDLAQIVIPTADVPSPGFRMTGAAVLNHPTLPAEKCDVDIIIPFLEPAASADTPR